MAEEAGSSAQASDRPAASGDAGESGLVDDADDGGEIVLAAVDVGMPAAAVAGRREEQGNDYGGNGIVGKVGGDGDGDGHDSSCGSGDGNGNDDGSGSGNSNENGHGNGHGNGRGNGHGNGNGNGNGNSNGIGGGSESGDNRGGISPASPPPPPPLLLPPAPPAPAEEDDRGGPERQEQGVRGEGREEPATALLRVSSGSAAWPARQRKFSGGGVQAAVVKNRGRWGGGVRREGETAAAAAAPAPTTAGLASRERGAPAGGGRRRRWGRDRGEHVQGGEQEKEEEEAEVGSTFFCVLCFSFVFLVLVRFAKRVTNVEGRNGRIFAFFLVSGVRCTDSAPSVLIIFRSFTGTNAKRS